MTWRHIFPLLFVLVSQAAMSETRGDKASPPKTARGLFWEVQGKSGPLYLLGSIHIGHPAMYPMNPEIEKAFRTSSELALEIDPGDGLDQSGTVAWFRQASQFGPEGAGLRKSISPATYSLLSRRLTERGISITRVEGFHPWSVAFIVDAMPPDDENGRRPKKTGDWVPGIDQYFADEARRLKKKIVEVESVQLQMNLFTKLSPQEEEAYLYSSLVTQPGVRDLSFKKLVSAWCAGDGDAMGRYINAEISTEPRLKPFMERVFEKRNVAMTDRIVSYLERGKSVFVVLGSGHFVGENGIVKLLQKKGYVVRQK